MPFKPFQKKDADPTVAADAPSFGKKFAKKKGRKAAPAQKKLMQGGRTMSGGGR